MSVLGQSPGQTVLHYDVVVLGAGGAGMMCAIEAGNRGRRVLLIDHASRLGGKILISGGGRCNFTNLGAGPRNYVSSNPHFCKSALSRYPSARIIELVDRHGIAYHEKKLGQLFCDESAAQIVRMLEAECEHAGAEIWLGTKIQAVEQLTPAAEDSEAARFEIRCSRGEKKLTLSAHSLVVATGGLSIPKIGATGIGYEIAKQFGLKLVDRAAALDGFVFADETLRSLSLLSGLSVDCVMTTGEISFRENLLFTHSGLSGPVALQASLHWYPGQAVFVDLLPGQDVFAEWITLKKQGNRSQVKSLLAERLPARLAEWLCDRYFPSTLPLPQVSERALEEFCKLLHAWKLEPSGTVGYNKAEVTRGGVDTDELSSKTMESKKVAGLYFVGEVVDVTGWLGGYNFQWAWASGWSAGQVV